MPEREYRTRAAMRLLPIAAGLLAACTTTTSPAATSNERQVIGAVQQPFQDIGLLRPDAPQVLKQAAIDLYSLAPDQDCQAMADEVVRLDAVLGPDRDKPAEDSEAGSINAGDIAADTIGGLVGLPFRGVVRWASGADARDRALANAILGGMLRRAFLKGVMRASQCGGHVEEAQ